MILFVLLAAGAWMGVRIGFQGPVLPPEALPTEGIVDMHAHVAGIGASNSGCFLSPRLAKSFRMNSYLKAFGVTRADLEREGDGWVVARMAERLDRSKQVRAAVVLALDGVIDENGELDRTRTEIYVPNDFVYQQTRTYPNLWFGASINPLRPDALARLERVHDQGAVLVKWLPSIQLFDPADTRFIPFYQKLAALGLPLLSHTGDERSFTRADNALADPQRLELALRQGVTVIAAHVATTGTNEGENNPDRLLRLMERYPNLYADISSLTQLNKLGSLNRFLKNPRVVERLVYGSDYPLIATPLVSAWYFPLQLSGRHIRRIQAIGNVWDRDVRLKQALGVPQAVFARSARLLAAPSTEK